MFLVLFNRDLQAEKVGEEQIRKHRLVECLDEVDFVLAGCG